HAGLQAAYLVLLDDHAHLAAVEFDQRADRVQPDALQELVDQGVAELRVAQLVEGFHRALTGHRAAVHTLTRHRAIAVDDASHLRRERNAHALQAARIAGAVETLVMRSDDRERRRVELLV